MWRRHIGHQHDRPESTGKHLEFNLALSGKTLLSAELENIRIDTSRNMLVILYLKNTGRIDIFGWVRSHSSQKQRSRMRQNPKFVSAKTFAAELVRPTDYFVNAFNLIKFILVFRL